jgi:hypothetical protein
MLYLFPVTMLTFIRILHVIVTFHDYKIWQINIIAIFVNKNC